MTSDRLTPAAVTARGWGWRHATRRAWAVRDLDLDISAGERVLLLGASGAGKSTLMHALAGVIGGDDEGEQQGELLVASRPATTSRGVAGLVLQDPDSQVILARVGDDVAFGCENLGVPRDEIWVRVDEALRAVGLALPLDHPTSALSGGQKQRLALAGVLAMRPGLILLDEPTANLDPEGVREVRDAVARVADSTGATLVVIEHRVEIWRDIVDRVVVLSPGGGVLADGEPKTVLGAHGASLAASGVWIPEFPPPIAPRRDPGVGGAERLLDASGLAIARTRGVPLAEGLELSFDAGTASALVGPNGAGKSTLALTLAGLLKPAAGQVIASDALRQGVGSSPIAWKSKQLLTRIGTVFQDPEHQFLTATVRDELSVGPRALAQGQADVTARVDELMQRLRLDHLALANPFTLSGGEKRRLSVATVLATRPRMLVLDEPTFGQDSRTWSELVALLAEQLDEGNSVLAVTHDAQFVRAIADIEVRLQPSDASIQTGPAVIRAVRRVGRA
ncbi:ABC transporter ATP-binding protein [Agreia sp. COWG]|uniref:ABC transporter ATP-binding protein n=1 Tax=Agreia sp. COWG TaxID=2773266 RepID=UPI0019264F42|nr:ATP-binding cassette domain-containing protein [Agreia sp. COWG]CAD5995942.1 ABC transporter ATP-binding protein [Agreia sp. COWG]